MIALFALCHWLLFDTNFLLHRFCPIRPPKLAWFGFTHIYGFIPHFYLYMSYEYENNVGANINFIYFIMHLPVGF